MLEFSRELDGLRRELKRLREREVSGAPGGEGGEEPTDERPPHY